MWDDIWRFLQGFAKKCGKEIDTLVVGMTAEEAVRHVLSSSTPGSVWDFVNPSAFSEQEKQEVEKILAKYGMKASLTGLDTETEVYMKLNQSLDNLSKNEREDFLKDLVAVLDTY